MGQHDTQSTNYHAVPVPMLHLWGSPRKTPLTAIAWGGGGRDREGEEGRGRGLGEGGGGERGGEGGASESAGEVTSHTAAIVWGAPGVGPNLSSTRLEGMDWSLNDPVHMVTIYLCCCCNNT